MAFKGRIKFPEFEADRLADAFQSGLSVSGVTETASAFQELMAKSLMITTFTNRRVAEAVLKKALRHTPVDTSDLFDSGKVVGTDTLGGQDLNPTVIEENVEATVAAYAAKLGIGGAFMGQSGFFAPRAFAKHSVIYTDWKAAAVHENPGDLQFRQVADERGNPKRHFPDDKTDHFLLNAYHAYKHRYSNAMVIGIQSITNAIGAYHAAKTLPRLIKAPR